MMDQINREGISRNWPDYEITRELGSGAFGKVYEIHRNHLGNDIASAVKVIHIPPNENYKEELLDLGMTQVSIQQFFQRQVNSIVNEITLMEKLKGASNIVTIEDCRVEKDSYGDGYTVYIKMELLESIHNLMRSHTLNADDIVTIGIDICNALIVCEQLNIVHRDIKPANVFINAFGTFKLGDFGIARQVNHTKTNMTQVGTSLYMAPELYQSDKADSRVDIYSLGIMLYRFANESCFPFVDASNISPETNQKGLMKRLSGAPLPMPSQVDEELGAIIVKACDYDPQKRFQNALALKNALELWRLHHKYTEDIKDADTTTKETKKKDPKKSGKFGLMAGIALLAIIVVAGALFALTGKERKEIKNPPVIADSVPSLQVGDTLTLGHYEGKEISWKVLRTQEKSAFVISNYVLLDKPYHDKSEAVTWESCSLRRWLNEDFYQEAFTQEEQALIQKSRVINPNNASFETNGGNQTKDYIYLLSLDEASKFLPADEDKVAVHSDGSEAWWWLRSPGIYENAAADILRQGPVDVDGSYVNEEYIGVRPVMWIDITE